METDKGTISIFDTRNPATYERRLGHPEPDATWFMNSLNPDKPNNLMTFTKERFFIGYNLNCQDFLHLRRDIARKALEFGLQDKNEKLNAKKNRAMVRELEKMVEEHEVIKNRSAVWEIPTIWSRHMNSYFVTKAVEGSLAVEGPQAVKGSQALRTMEGSQAV